MEYYGNMNKFYLAIRILVLLALLFLLAAVFWGVANREKTVAHDGSEVAPEYRRTKPAAYTSVLLIALVVLGIFVVLGSIVFEYHRSRSFRVPPRDGEGGGRRRGATWS
jgi:ABC-type Fe3+ transport system permease subunit